MSSELKQRIGFFLLRLSGIIVIFILGIILFDIIRKGSGAISWQFLAEAPRNGMTEGGIYPALIGTLYVTLLTALVSVPLGVFAAIYLNDYPSSG
ncbi:MAG: hypothetical protein UMV23_07270 [Halanaerobium sp.]|nr:hypothetical protein [Halanaerobium sp.]